MADKAYHKRDLYNEVTARILAELEAGAAPWIKPWSATPGLNHPHNAATNRPYSGCLSGRNSIGSFAERFNREGQSLDCDVCVAAGDFASL